MNIEKIINTYCCDATETKKNNIRGWFARIEKMANTTSLRECLHSKDFLLKCFSSSKATTVSRPQYLRIKEILLYLCDYYDIPQTVIPSRDEVLATSQMCGFFGDLKSALSFIDKVGSSTIAEYDYANGLLRHKSIVILTWLGFTPSEISELTYSDVIIDDAIHVERGEKNVVVSREVYQILAAQMEQKGLMAFPSGRIYSYKTQTSYLIKNREGGQVNPDHLHHLFKQFNERANQENILSFRGLELSGLFVKIRNDTANENLYVKIQRHANCDRYVSYGYKKLYLQWLKSFFQEKE